MLSRVFVVIAAALFVLSAALASVVGPMMPLNEGIRQVDMSVLLWLNDHASEWVKQWLLLPFMVRPVWLLPVSLGVVALGVAASVNSVRGTPFHRKG